MRKVTLTLGGASPLRKGQAASDAEDEVCVCVCVCDVGVFAMDLRDFTCTDLGCSACTEGVSRVWIRPRR